MSRSLGSFDEIGRQISAGTLIDLIRVPTVPVPLVRARYELREIVPGGLAAAVRAALPATWKPLWK